MQSDEVKRTAADSDAPDPHGAHGSHGPATVGRPAAVAVFDLDGTLVDSSRDIHEALAVALRTIDDGRDSAAADEQALHSGAHGQTLEQFFGAARPRLSADGLRALIAVYRKRYYEHLLDNTRPFPGVLDGLERLRRLREDSARGGPDGPRLRLCIATTKLTATALRVTKGLGLLGYFDQVLGSDGLRAKPDPAVVHAVFTRLGRAPGLVAQKQWDVMVGDTDFDVLAGRAAGLSTCAVGWSELPRERLLASRPDFVARTFTEVVELIVSHTLPLW